MRIDNCPFDILDLIAAWISPSDRAAVSLVSKSLHSAIIPFMYSCLRFGRRQCSNYGRSLSPFQVIIQRPHLAVHVRTFDISQIPTTAHGPDPNFLKECALALGLCDGIIRFISPSFEPLSPRILFDGLRDKTKLQVIKLEAALDKDHANMLMSLTKLREINLERPSDPVISLLPMWVPNLSSLTAISLSHSSGINPGTLGLILSAVPRLLSLSVRKCWLLRLHHIFETVSPACPSLEYLSIHTEEVITMPRLPPSTRLYHLRHLKIGAENREDNLGLTPGFHNAWNYSLECVKESKLISLSLGTSFRSPMSPVYLPMDLLYLHKATLKAFVVSGAYIAPYVVKLLCVDFQDLKLLGCALYTEYIDQIIVSLSRASQLRSLLEVNHRDLEPNIVRHVFKEVPHLRSIVLPGGSRWTNERTVVTMPDGMKGFSYRVVYHRSHQ